MPLQLEVERIDGLIVQRLDGRIQVELPKAYARESIPSRRDQIPTPEVADKWPHLQKIRDKIPPYEKDAEIGLLTGCNCSKAIKLKGGYTWHQWRSLCSSHFVRMVYRGTCRDLRQLFGRPRPEFHMPLHPSERESSRRSWEPIEIHA